MALPDIVIFGRGYLGERFAQYFGERAIMSSADITKLEEISSVISEIKPRVIINAAGKTLTAEIERPENQSLAYTVNVQGPANLAYLAHIHGFHLVHLSSDMVYGGLVPKEGWRENDRLNPQSYYAWTKAWADYQLEPFAGTDPITIVRLRTPFSALSHSRNLLNKLLTFEKVVDAPTSLTVVEDILEVVDQLIAKKCYGLFNVVNPGVISLYDIVQRMQYAGLLPENKTIERLSAEEFARINKEMGKAFQPFPILNTDKLEKAGVRMRNVTDAVQASINQFAKSTL